MKSYSHFHRDPAAGSTDPARQVAEGLAGLVAGMRLLEGGVEKTHDVLERHLIRPGEGK